jgi:superfamily II DNA or RNA helicase
MATGTGKTRTATRICEILAHRGEIDTIVVSADGLDLLEQWHVNLLAALPHMQVRFSVLRHYGANYERERFVLDPRRRILLASRPALAQALRSFDSRTSARTLLIHDEVHRLGSPANRATLDGLAEKIRFRLGLSATPEREYDSEGTDFIQRHVGPVIFRFGLADAIRRGILAPFRYCPIDYDLDEQDRRRLQDVYRRAEAKERAGEPMSQEEIWIELAKVHKTSLTKIPFFENFLQRTPHILDRCIIFVETQEYGEEVLRVVHRCRHDFHTYYSGEDSETLRRFARGDINCLITCHRLSEGIDIKSINSVVLFSSSRAPLETIQRMGRCLRTDPGNPSKRAWIVDFIRHDPDSSEKNIDVDRKQWLTELSTIEPEVISIGSR